MNAKHLADLLDAEDRLKARGYKKVPCERCNGTGVISFDRPGASRRECYKCDGDRHTWEAPDGMDLMAILKGP